MKRIYAVLLCIIVAMTLCALPMAVSAEETIAEIVETETSVADEPAETPVPEAPEGASSGEPLDETLFTRLWEFFRTYSGETLSVAGSLVLLILNLIIKHSSTKGSKDTKASLKGIKEKVDETLDGQSSVVNVVNQMIDGYNSMKNSYDTYGNADGERNRVVGAVLATNTAILEILTTVYVNNRNLPQGVKDLINLKYANCLRTLEDDEKLKAIVEAVRDNIGMTAESTTEDAEV